MTFSDPGFTSVSTRSAPAKENLFKTGNFTTTIEFENHTGKTLYFKNIRNAVFAVEPETTVEKTAVAYDHLAIHIKYELTNISNISKTKEIIEALVANGTVLTEEADRFYQQIKQLYHENPGSLQRRTLTFNVTRVIDASQISKSALVIIHDTAMVTSMYKDQIKKPHPYSPQGLQEVDMQQQKSRIGMTGVFLKVVDNEMIASTRYFYAGKQLISVPSIVDKNRESGVYATIASGCHDNTVDHKTEYYSFAEAEEILGLFKSQEQAITHGNPELIKETEIAQYKLKESELRREALDLKRKLNDQEAELAEIKRQNTLMEETLKTTGKIRDHQHETKSMKKKDKYEKRSTKRKDKSEIIKFIPTMITGAIAIGMLFFKLLGSKSSFA